MAEERDDEYQGRGRHRERSGRTSSGNLKELIAAGTTTAAGVAANRALAEPEMPPFPPAPAWLSLSVPIPEKESESDQ